MGVVATQNAQGAELGSFHFLFLWVIGRTYRPNVSVSQSLQGPVHNWPDYGTFSLFFRQLLTTPHVAFTHARLSWPVGYIGPYKEPLAECQRHSPRSYRANCRARINNLSVARCLPYPSVSTVLCLQISDNRWILCSRGVSNSRSLGQLPTEPFGTF